MALYCFAAPLQLQSSGRTGTRVSVCVCNGACTQRLPSTKVVRMSHESLQIQGGENFAGRISPLRKVAKFSPGEILA